MYQNVPIELIERIEALERRMEKNEKETPSNLPLYGEALQTSRTNYSKRTLLGGCRTAEPKSASSLTSTLTLALRELMECKAPDGRYLMRHRYQWWAVYHVLVRQCGFPDGYREFVACIAQLFPEGLPLLVQR